MLVNTYPPPPSRVHAKSARLALLFCFFPLFFIVSSCGSASGGPTGTPGPTGDTPADPVSRTEPSTRDLADGTNGWEALLAEIAAEGKYVALDLSACAMSGTAFDPDSSNSTGKALIVSLVLPSAAESIAAGDLNNAAFKDFTNLTTVSGENVTAIGDFTFGGRIGLTSVSFPKATSIGYEAFFSCIGLTSVTIPQVENISYYAFGYCTSLTSVSLPRATSIDGYAFYNCHALNNVSLPATLTTIDGNPFDGCTSLTNLTVAAGNNDYSAVNGMLMNKAGDTLISYPTATGAVNLPAITAVDTSAFVQCRDLTSVTLSQAVSVGQNAFQRCTGLTTVTLSQATSIGRNAFEYCTSLTSVSLPEAASIGAYAFSQTGTTVLTVTLGATPPTVGNNMFDLGDPKTVTVRVPYANSTAWETAGYNPTWQEAFRGKGGNSAAANGGGTENTNITVNYLDLPRNSGQADKTVIHPRRGSHGRTKRVYQSV